MVVVIGALKFMNYGPVLVNLCGVNQFRSWAFLNALRFLKKMEIKKNGRWNSS